MTGLEELRTKTTKEMSRHKLLDKLQKYYRYYHVAVLIIAISFIVSNLAVSYNPTILALFK